MTELQTLVENSQWPLLTAFVLGVLVALHPCPMATNIAAMGYIGKDVDNRRQVFIDGLLYTLGRTISYSLLGAVLILLIRGGAELLHFGEVMSEWGERILGPLLILIGFYLLYNDLLHHHDHVPHLPFGGKKAGPILLGLLFALAFCPESGIVYFGMLIPLSVESSYGYLLPVAFAVGTGFGHHHVVGVCLQFQFLCPSEPPDAIFESMAHAYHCRALYLGRCFLPVRVMYLFFPFLASFVKLL